MPRFVIAVEGAGKMRGPTRLLVDRLNAVAKHAIGTFSSYMGRDQNLFIYFCQISV